MSIVRGPDGHTYGIQGGQVATMRSAELLRGVRAVSAERRSTAETVLEAGAAFFCDYRRS
jgi:hypothetical protein